MRKLTNSNSQFKKAIQKLPLGVSSNFRYWGADKTLYIKKGKGGKIWDLDNNEYIDYRLAYGPIILGYQDERVDEAARLGMDIGGVFALATELEYEIAERINKMVKSAELVRFSNSGTEAVMAALRVARAYTGKDGHVILEGGYHGVFSEVMWYSEIEDWDPKTGNPDLLPFGEGIPKVTKKLNYTVPINNANAVEDLFKKSAHDIGAFLARNAPISCADFLKRSSTAFALFIGTV